MATQDRWTTLPQDLQESILSTMHSPIDYVRFSCVCKSWNFWSHNIVFKKYIPFLLISPQDSTEAHSLYDLNHKKTYNNKLYVPFANTCIGSSHGFLISPADGNMLTLTLFNLLTRISINIPPIHLSEAEAGHLPVYYHKAILSTDPNLFPNTYTLAAIIGPEKRLALFRSESRDWVRVNTISGGFHDLIFHNNLLHVVDLAGRLSCVDTVTLHQSEVIATREAYNMGVEATYLVDTPDGELYMVEKVSGLSAYKFTGEGWAYVRRLGGYSFFVGDHSHSMSLLASDYPNVRANSIYFIDNYKEMRIKPNRTFGMAEYDVKKRITDKLYPMFRFDGNAVAPTWIVPN